MFIFYICCFNVFRVCIFGIYIFRCIRFVFSRVDMCVIFLISFRNSVDSASNRNEYQEHFLGAKAAGAYG